MVGGHTIRKASCKFLEEGMYDGVASRLDVVSAPASIVDDVLSHYLNLILYKG